MRVEASIQGHLCALKRWGRQCSCRGCIRELQSPWGLAVSIWSGDRGGPNKMGPRSAIPFPSSTQTAWIPPAPRLETPDFSSQNEPGLGYQMQIQFRDHCRGLGLSGEKGEVGGKGGLGIGEGRVFRGELGGMRISAGSEVCVGWFRGLREWHRVWDLWQRQVSSGNGLKSEVCGVQI